ncbi:M4 family metallopeptidase [Phytomonospora sp. NPDC050363]|uniref:M4 family metallopeptidase n=1 Tax=Phytomonospora sp. NPDC050363 TaxID=3155642 RepID=UPI0033CBB3BE
MSRSRVRLLAMTTAACAAAALLTATPAHAEDGVDPSAIVPGTGTDTPAQVSGDEKTVSADDPVAAAKEYLGEHQATFAIDGAELTPIGTYAADGTETVRFAQSHQGVPVFGAQYLVHMRPDGGDTTVLGANGSYYSDLTVDTVATASAESAVEQARGYVAGQLSKGVFDGGGIDAVSGVSKGLVIVPDGSGRLAYQVTVTTVDPKEGTPVVKEVFVDADTAWPMFSYDGIQFSSPVEGTGVKADGSEVPLGLTQADDGTFQMVDQSHGSTISTYDGRAYDVNDVLGRMPADMPVFVGPTAHFDGEATESGAVDAHANAAHVYDYYAGLGRDGLDGQGADMVSVVGVTSWGQPFVNAFWDGQKMVYGGGDAEYKTLSADLDVVGHEMTHGVIEHSAGLIYAHQSGAMNEAIADYFGNAVDVDVTGTSMRHPDAGLLGEDLCRTATPRECALRDLNDGRTTADYEGLTWEYDNGGVHYNSTIFSGALWDIRETIGGEKADRLIYKALTEYMTPTDDFVDGRNAVIQAAFDSRLSLLTQAKIVAAFVKHGIITGWEQRSGDAKILMEDITAERTGPAAAGGWWVAPKGEIDGDGPYALYSGRTNGKGEPIKLAEPEGDRFNVLPATDGQWAVWFAWGSSDAKIMRAPVDGSAPAEVLWTTRGASALSVHGDWISWNTFDPRSGTKQWYMNAAVPGSAQMVDNTYYMRSGFGEVRDGKLYYLLDWPDRTDGGRMHLNIAVRDLATGQETLLPEILDASGEASADLYAPKVTDEHIVIGVDQVRGGPAGIWRMNLDGTGVTTLIDEAEGPLLGGYDATEEAVTYENWPGVTVPQVYQIGIDGGAAKRMSCADGLQYRVTADEGRRALWLDGSYGTTALVTRDKPVRRCR